MTAARHGNLLAAVRIEVDLKLNTLVVHVSGAALEPGAVSGHDLTGTLDIGTGGQLIGLEIGRHYVSISDPVRGAEHLTRSVDIPVTVGKDSHGKVNAVSFRRCGDHYEISFPSGNQCWHVEGRGSAASGTVCSVVID